jgi:hypothetical protein
MTTESGVTIRSLTELDVLLSKEVHDHLSAPYEVLYADDTGAAAARHLDDVLRAMKTAPRTSMCRVNRIRSSKEEVIRSLEQEMSQWISSCNVEQQLSVSVSAHNVLDDVVCIDISSTRENESLTDNRIPPADECSPIFASWPGREKIGWPMTHKVIICDRFCGEAVLRGSSIFVKGVLCADAGIVAGDEVTVYADWITTQAPASFSAWVRPAANAPTCSTRLKAWRSKCPPFHGTEQAPFFLPCMESCQPKPCFRIYRRLLWGMLWHHARAKSFWTCAPRRVAKHHTWPAWYIIKPSL